MDTIEYMILIFCWIHDEDANSQSLISIISMSGQPDLFVCSRTRTMGFKIQSLIQVTGCFPSLSATKLNA